MKGQGEAVAMSVVLIIAAVSLIIGLFVVTSIYESVDNDEFLNESLGRFNSSAATTFCVDRPPIISGSQTIYNSSYSWGSADGDGQNELTISTEYTINYVTGCITNATDEVEWLRVTYTNAKVTAAGQATLTVTEATTMSAFELAVVGLIVLAAVAVLGYVFLLAGKKM